MVISPSSSAVVAATLALSYVLAQALVLSAHKHGHLTMDFPGAIQKFHLDPTPRVGGVAIYIAVVLAWVCAPGPQERKLLATLLVAGMPALLIGLLEDVTKRVS